MHSWPDPEFLHANISLIFNQLKKREYFFFDCEGLESDLVLHSTNSNIQYLDLLVKFCITFQIGMF